MKSRYLLAVVSISLVGCALPAVMVDVPNPQVIFPDRVAMGDASVTDTGILTDMGPGFDAPNPSIDGGSAAEIRAVVTAPAGMLNLPVTNVLVTYVVPTTAGANVANDPPGFTVQAEGPGPALFIAVDPAMVAPTPVVGDRVSFRVTTTRAQNANSSRWVTALTGYARMGQNVSLDGMTQDFSNTGSLVVSLNNYEYQLNRITATITDSGTNSGSGFRSFAITTAGIAAGDPNLRMRIPQTLATTLNLRQGCRVTLGPTPLWRFTAQVQPSAWTANDIMVSNCGAVNDGGMDVPNAPVDVPNPPVDVPNPPADVPGCNAVPIINEIQTSAMGAASSEFIELYNPGNCTVNLNGWRLRYASSQAQAEPAGMLWVGAAETIAPLGYAVIGTSQFMMAGGVTQGTFSAGLADPAGGVGLYEPGGRRVDQVAWAQTAGDINAMHIFRSPVGGSFAPVPPSAPGNVNRLTARIPNGANTGNQGADFQARTTGSPGAANM